MNGKGVVLIALNALWKAFHKAFYAERIIMQSNLRKAV
jgi:hypothetical protein